MLGGEVLPNHYATLIFESRMQQSLSKLELILTVHALSIGSNPFRFLTTSVVCSLILRILAEVFIDHVYSLLTSLPSPEPWRCRIMLDNLRQVSSSFLSSFLVSFFSFLFFFFSFFFFLFLWAKPAWLGPKKKTKDKKCYRKGKRGKRQQEGSGGRGKGRRSDRRWREDKKMVKRKKGGMGRGLKEEGRKEGGWKGVRREVWVRVFLKFIVLFVRIDLEFMVFRVSPSQASSPSHAQAPIEADL